MPVDLLVSVTDRTRLASRVLRRSTARFRDRRIATLARVRSSGALVAVRTRLGATPVWSRTCKADFRRGRGWSGAALARVRTFWTLVAVRTRRRATCIRRGRSLAGFAARLDIGVFGSGVVAVVRSVDRTSTSSENSDCRDGKNRRSAKERCHGLPGRERVLSASFS